MTEDREVRTVGRLRAITAQPRAVDAVEVYVYLPGTRGPVRCYIAGHTLRAPSKGGANVLTLQLRPEPLPEPEPPAVAAEPEPEPEPDRGPAGRKAERVPNADEPV